MGNKMDLPADTAAAMAAAPAQQQHHPEKHAPHPTQQGTASAAPAAKASHKERPMSPGPVPPKSASKKLPSASPTAAGVYSPAHTAAASGAGTASPGKAAAALHSLDSDESPRDSPRGDGPAVEYEDVTDIQRRYSHVGGKAVSIKDFDLLKVLGKGSFGKVMLVRYKGASQLYAMKTLRKEALIRRNQLAHTSTERFILQNISHPFLMRLNFAFQTKEKLYMVVDYMAGGELFFWLKKGKFSESRAKLYAAEITCALEALHAHNIVYRDLKPENILLDADGHVRLTDFGLSKGGVTGYGPEGGTSTFCGTPEYLAPEVLENKGHGKGIDWWSLGTLMYEMVCGLPPFYDQNVQKMYKKILTAPLAPPKTLSEDAKSIIKGLLERRVSARLGCGAAGALEIKRHPYFACYDWEKVVAKGYQPEFVPPRRRRSIDVDNFDKEFTAEPAVDSVVQTTLNAQQQEMAQFKDFTYDANAHASRLR